jgi:hypothetical protein
MVEPLRHRQTKEAATDMFDLQPPPHISTLPLSTLTAARQFVSNRGQSGLVSDSIREDGPPVQKFGSLNKVHSRGLTDMTLGLLDRGAWRADDPTRIKDGHFIRPPTTYHNFITADGRPGPTGQGDFPAEAGRYHLYVSLACPWAQPSSFADSRSWRM